MQFPTLNLESADKILLEYGKVLTIDINPLLDAMSKKMYTKDMEKIMNSWFQVY